MTTTSTPAGGVTYGRAIELKTADEGWTCEGYVSTYDVDLGNDRVLPGAYRKTLSDGHKVKFLFAHDQAKVLGVPLTLEEDGKRGLYGRFRISKTQVGQDVRQLLLDGALDSFSVGYIARDYEHDPQSGVRTLKAIDLLECSVVSLPMNPAAVVTAAKQAATKSLVLEHLERRVAGLRTKVAVLEARNRIARMTPQEVQREAEAMKLRMRARELLGAVTGGR